MKHPITKLAVAAAFIGGASLLIMLTLETSGPAYALEQTIEANNQLRCLHMKTFAAGHDEPKEFWLQCDESGQIQNARWYMPAWDAPEDGAKLVVWKSGRLQIWFQGTQRRGSALASYTRQQPPFWLLDFARMSNPKVTIAQLKEVQNRGEVELEIQEPTDQARPIVVTATYLPQSQSPGRRTVLRVNQATKLVASIDVFAPENGQSVFKYRQEFSDYNVPIAPAMFDLDALVPADVQRVDGDAHANDGLPQGGLSDREIATKVVRQYFAALIAQDYETAGRLLCGTPAEKMKQIYANKRFIRIVSIGEPTPHPTNPQGGGLRVPCKIEREEDGVKSMWEPYGPFVRPIKGVTDGIRWEIHGGL